MTPRCSRPRPSRRLADKLAISIRVSHAPPGTSKWNKIEHRWFSFISIANTTNRRPRRPCATRPQDYPTGKKISAKELRAIKIDKDTFHGEWNDVIRPRIKTG